MPTIQFIQITPKELQDAIIDGVKSQLEEFQKNFQPKEPTQYVTRDYIANEMLHCNLSTVHNLTKQGILIKYGIGRRVLYKRSQVEEAITLIKP